MGFQNRHLTAAEKVQSQADDVLIDRYHAQKPAPAPQAAVTADLYATARRVAEQAKHVDPGRMTADERRAVALTKGIIDRYEAENPKAAPARTHGPHGTYAEHGKPLPWWMAKDANGQGITTVDHRDPAFAPKPLDPARQKLADAMRGGADGRPVKVEVTDASAARIGGHVGKGFASSFPAGAVPHGSNSLAALHREWYEAEKSGDLDRAKQHLANMRVVQAARAGLLFPHLHHPHGITPSVMASIDNSRKRGDATLHYAPQFHSHGGDARTLMADARRDAGRGSADLMRNLMTTET